LMEWRLPPHLCTFSRWEASEVPTDGTSWVCSARLQACQSYTSLRTNVRGDNYPPMMRIFPLAAQIVRFFSPCVQKQGNSTHPVRAPLSCALPPRSRRRATGPSLVCMSLAFTAGYSDRFGSRGRRGEGEGET